MNSNISVHIERLILDGVRLSHHQRRQVQAAFEAELAHLLSSGGLAADLQTQGSWSHFTGGTVQLPEKEGPDQLGKRIAQAVYRGIGI